MSLSAEVEVKLIAAVRQIAAEEILPRFRALDPADIATKSRHDDLVTAADLAAEKRLAEAVSELLPGAVVVGEEAVSADPSIRDQIAGADRSVIIDPVDGTWNFAHGVRTFGVMVAVAEKGETVWGLIYDPLGDDWTVAARGEGARFASGEGPEFPLAFVARDARPIGNTMGYVHSYLYKGEERRRLFARLAEFHKTDALRCSAHEYRLFLQGAVDFCLSPVMNPWDHAPGCLMAEEAGGVARLLDGRPYAPTVTEGRLLVARDEATWAAVAAHLDGVS